MLWVSKCCILVRKTIDILFVAGQSCPLIVRVEDMAMISDQCRVVEWPQTVDKGTKCSHARLGLFTMHMPPGHQLGVNHTSRLSAWLSQNPLAFLKLLIFSFCAPLYASNSIERLLTAPASQMDNSEQGICAIGRKRVARFICLIHVRYIRYPNGTLFISWLLEQWTMNT